MKGSPSKLALLVWSKNMIAADTHNGCVGHHAPEPRVLTLDRASIDVEADDVPSRFYLILMMPLGLASTIVWVV